MNKREKILTFGYYIIAVLSLFISVGTAGPEVSSETKYSMEILGFYTEDESPIPGSSHVLHDHAENLTFIAPFYYRLKKDASGIESMKGLNDSQIKDTIREAHKRNVKVLALVHNMLYGKPETGKKAAREMLHDSDSRKRFINDLLEIVLERRYDGINLDIEDIYYKSRPKYLSFDIARFIADNTGSVPVFNEVYGAPHYKYSKESQNHEVWFEDKESFKVKASLAEKWQLKGIAIWRLGMEDPGVWEVVNREILVAK